MGRPLDDKFFGDPSDSGNQLSVEAWIPGGGSAVTAWIIKQNSNTTYTVTDGTDTGRCKLQAEPITGAGQMRIAVMPFGFDIAAGTADMEVETVLSIPSAGSGYSVADTLTLSGGTFDTAATLDVDTVGTITGQDETNFDGAGSNGSWTMGTGYSISDTITLSDGTVVTVDDVASLGEVLEFTITTNSTSGTASDGASLTQSSTSGGGAGFALTFGLANQEIFAVSIADGGDYSVLPSNPISHTGGSGTGATFNVDWQVLEINVTAGGSGYVAAPAVTITGGGTGATATSTLTGDAVSSATVTAPGDNFTSVPTVTFAAPAGDAEYVRILNAHQVKTFAGNVYKWSELAADSFDEADLPLS